MKRKNMKCPTHTNRKMNPETYKLRRIVMEFIYEAKELLGGNMPRVDIRITDCDRHRTLGEALMNGCSIWIPATTLEKPATAIRHVVFHELAHAVFGAEHDESCPLMAPVINSTTRGQQNRAFLKHARAA